MTEYFGPWELRFKDAGRRIGLKFYSVVTRDIPHILSFVFEAIVDGIFL